MSKSSLKSAGSKSLRPNRLYAAVLLALSGQAMALPEGGQVVAGDAAISVSGDTMQILQNSQRAILNFQSFDIASQQTVNFQQPGADAVALNRVLGDRLSEIHGALNANGQIYLINPNGVLFGNGAEINVGSLVVTTLDIADQDFLAGRDAFSGSANGRVENRGRIDADGRVVLLAPEVINSGAINVPDGDIVLQSSRQALLHTPGSEIPILVEDADLIGRVVNEGTLTAGEVALILHSDKAQLAYDAAINNSGLVRAVRATGEGGEIHLLSGAAIVNSGTLDASADTGAGGEITLAAEAINQSGQITAKAAGTGDGGEISLLATNAIAIHSGSLIDASADQVGDAGDVVIIAEKSTWFTEDSNINARGGEIAGDGGFVEVSGLEFINVAGNVNTGASNGEGGLWYIDPTDITITDGAAGDFNSDFTGGNPNNWFPNSGQNASTISVTSLRNQLVNHGNVRIATNYMSPSNTGVTGNITFDAVFDFDGLGTGRSITLEADNQIIFTRYGGIWDSSGEGDGLNLNFTAANGFIIEDSNPTAPIPEDRELGGIVNSGLGTINITVLDGDALVTGLASAATGLDAIKLDVQNGAIIENGNSLWDVMLLTNGGGVTLKAQSGISGLSIRNNEGGVSLLDASTTTGNISGVRAAGHLEISRLVVGSTSSAAVSAEGQLKIGSGAQLIGKSFDFESDTLIVIPNGFTTAGTLRLDAPDITDLTSSRNLNFGADHLIIDTEATGGNLTINSTVNTLSVTNRSTNTIIVDDTDDLILGTIEPLVGAIMVSSGSGTDLTVGEDINLTSMNGALTLNAGRDLLVNAAILDGAAITLTAPRNVLFSADGAVDAGSGNIGITATSGNVALGALTGGAITVNAGGSITDANGSGVNLSATSAILTAGTGSIGALADGLETSVGTLTLNSANGSAFISNSQALNLTSVNVGDDLNVSLPTAGNLTLNQSTPTIGGTATFSVANGQLIVPAIGGWNTTGNLTVNATRIVDSNASATVSLTANNADLTLTGAVASTLNVDFNTLALQLSGGPTQTVQVADANALSIFNLSSDGNLTLSTANGFDLTITDTTPVSSGQLTLNAGGDLLLSTAGLNVAGDLTLSADDVSDGDANVILGAANADITLRNATGARTWTTSFAQLALEITGTGDFSLANDQDLVLTSVVTGVGDASISANGDLTFHSGTIEGNASFIANNGDVVLMGTPTVTGSMTLATVGSGDVILPSGGISIDGNLAVNADNLQDGDSDITLAAANASITLRGSADRTWITSFDELALSLAGGNLSLTDTDGLTLTSLSGSGNVSITTTNADLELDASPTLTGNLSLLTDGSGNVVIPVAGLTIGGDLTVDADNLVDDNHDVTLGAAAANITLRDAGAQARNWTTTFDELVLDIAGTGDFSLTNTDTLILSSITTGGNASIATLSGGLTLGSGSIGGNAAFTAADGDLEFTNAPTFSGDLSLTASSGAVIVDDAGLIVTGDLTIDAQNLRDSNADLTLEAATANITLSAAGSQARTWITTFDELVLDITGTGGFELTNTGDLTLTSVTTGGNASFSTNGDLTLGGGAIGGNAAFTATNGDVVMTSAPTITGDLSLTTVGSGDAIVSNAGLSAGGNLTVDADDLRDSDGGELTLAANNADITLRVGAPDRNWSTTFNDLVLSLTGAGDFSLNNTGALALSLTTTGGTASFTSNGDLTLNAGTIGGSATLTANNGNVELVTAPSVTGNLSLTTVGTGNVILSEDGLTIGGDLTVDADDLRDSDANVILTAATATITLRNEDNLARDWTTTFEELVLDIAGTGDFNLTNTGDLTVTSATTGGSATFATEGGSLTMGAGTIGGDASFSATDGDLVFTNAPTVMGDLTLTTTGTGAVIVSDGLSVGGDLTVDAGDLRDIDGGDLTLAADNANITLRDTGAQARNWTTSFNELVLDIAGDGDFLLTDTDGLTLTSVTTGGNATFSTQSGTLTVGAGDIGGDASFSTTGADLIFTDAPTVAGGLSLTTNNSGDIVLPTAGLRHTGTLTVHADNLVADDIILGATDADITLRGGNTAQTWNTSFDTLALSIAGTGNFTLADTDGLILTSVTTGGNASFSTTDADLVLMDSPDVDGTLTLITTGNGDLVIPDAGLIHTGALALDVARVRDSDSTLDLAATQLTAHLRNQQGATTWNTALDSLALTLAGGGHLTLQDAGALTVTHLTTDGALTLSAADDLVVQDLSAAGNVALTSGGDLSLLDNDLGGDLQLITAPNGTLTTSSNGLRVAGDLSVDAGQLLDSDGESAALWSAASVDLRLRSSSQPTRLNLQTGSLALSQDTDAALELQLQDGALVSALSSGGDVRITSDGDLNLGANTVAVDGLLDLDLDGDLVLTAAGLTFDGDLRLVADGLRDADGGAIQLAGQSADLTLGSGTAVDLNTQLARLGVTYGGTGAFTLTNDRNLELARFSAPGVSQVNLTVNGDLIIPDSGLTASQRLNVDAVDLRDSDRNLILAAPRVAVRLSNAAGDSTWNLDADVLDVLMRGASLTVAAQDGLTLDDINGDGQAVSMENGNFLLALGSGDLTVAADVNAADLVADGVRTGVIDLSLAAGNLIIDPGVNLVSSNTVDTDAAGPAGNESLRLRLLDASAADRTITLGAGGSLRSVGGDILIDTKPAGTAPGARRQWVQGAGSQVVAYDNPGDPITGEVWENGALRAQISGETVRAGRTLTIVSDVSAPDLGDVRDQIDDLDGQVPVLDGGDASGPKVSQQFDQVFGTCDELDQKNRHRCRVDAALKAFLSHWLVGGEMPPKTENPR